MNIGNIYVEEKCWHKTSLELNSDCCESVCSISQVCSFCFNLLLLVLIMHITYQKHLICTILQNCFCQIICVCVHASVCVCVCVCVFVCVCACVCVCVCVCASVCLHACVRGYVCARKHVFEDTFSFSLDKVLLCDL